jgi:putative ATPase
MIPLADRLRPARLSEYIGQKHLLGPDKLLFKSIQNNQLFSMILWGPPGVGKTTLARIIAAEVDADFMEFSAVSTGIAELKKVFEQIRSDKTLFSKPDTIIFIDEIHRFNKAQQDALLPYVENGTITLIGATTENPSFEIIAPLLSRTRVFVLQQHQPEDLEQVISRALKDKTNGLGNFKVTIGKDAIELLIEGSNGDARNILNTLEIAVLNSSLSGKKSIKLNKSDIEEAFQKRALSYDKGGEEHYNTISAFIKSMRASQPDAALYYLAKMIESGEDPLFIARRMVIFASEDIGVAQPTALVVANEVFRACETIGLPECAINLAHGVVYLSSAKKDRTANDAYFAALSDVRQYGNLPIPMNLRNAPTKLMKEIGYGKDYQKYSTESYLPDKLKDKKYLKSS